MKHYLFKTTLVVTVLLIASCSNTKKIAEAKAATQAKEAKKPKPKKGAIQPYDKVITKEAKTDEGLFKVHTIDDTFLYEIPDSLLNREMLMVTRISKTASGLGFGGGKQNTKVLRWQKKGKKILLRVVSHQAVANDSLPVYQAVANSNFEPVLYTFPIKAYSKDSTATVIDVTELFKKDIKALGLPAYRRKQYKVTRLDANTSFIEGIKSYPLNIEARHVKTYAAGAPPSNRSTGAISIEINNSMVLLPKVPMQRRNFDQRVGWFASSQIDYGSEAHKSETVRYIDRWRLEVKAADLEKFKRGELVEPKKQIVYYIDRATPKKWRKYIKQGIEDWQVAFEAAGFKNAIIAKDPPTQEEDPEWSPEDIRYSVVRYLASPIPNANGPHVSDPRSGEILESDINWYHNIMTLVHNWFFVQTAAINPEARTPKFKDEVMGQLIRFVSSHEVGHTLGLPHNMGSSAAYPVEKLRNPEFTKKYGTAPSIMDYARFNYVAQPEDGDVGLTPKIGVYDKYAIAWGYTPILEAKTPKHEKKTLDSWILEHAGDPMYRFGKQQRSTIDPSSQMEDLGDDAMLASHYGILNLKRIVPNLIDWTAEEGKNYDDLKGIYKQVLDQFSRYMGHVTANLGGVYENYKTYDQEGAVYTHVNKQKQEEAIAFLNKQLFQTPEWLLDTAIFNKIENTGQLDRIGKLQTRTLKSILSAKRMSRIVENEVINGNDAYSLLTLMEGLRNGVWSELKNGENSDPYRRNLQRSHIEILGDVLKEKSPKDIQSDSRAIVRAELKTIKRLIKNVLNKSGNKMNQFHLEDLLQHVNDILNPKNS